MSVIRATGMKDSTGFTPWGSVNLLMDFTGLPAEPVAP